MTAASDTAGDFTSILVANRGEIALRIMRTARDLGYRVVAIYSEADRDAPHVRAADCAICVGPPAAGDSYLDIDRVLRAAREGGADAIHPGYGFLSENADFVSACETAGITFIGPSSQAVALMGNKAAAKRYMQEAGVPCVPGYEEPDADDASLIEAAQELGFPLMVKAAAGGGGRGMVRVATLEALPEALHSARSVASNSFGSGELILEQAVECPRHVEIQVFADAHGNVIHLGERDCSTQRRHQKVVEEAPCPVMTEALRAAMGEAAVAAARAIDYRGAGTVEFLLDVDGTFYFLEMNTRLQVEHPVTEMVTGLDLVELQLRVARGEPLGITQREVILEGCAMEARLYAESPQQGFLPRTGRIELWRPPPAARVDGGIETGSEITPYYDPMLAKIIVHAPGREAARRKLIAALKDTVLFGVQSNRDFLLEVLQQEAFVRGEVSTDFVAARYGTGAWRADSGHAGLPAIAAVLLCLHARREAHAACPGVAPELLNWSSGAPLASRFRLAGEQLLVHPGKGDVFQVNHREQRMRVELLALQQHRARLRLDGEAIDAWFLVSGPGVVHVSVDGVSATFRDAFAQTQGGGESAGSGRILAPMHGVVQDLFVEQGQPVSRGQRLAVVEAMKMQHEIVADLDGVVSAVRARPGAQVAAEELLLEIEPEARE